MDSDCDCRFPEELNGVGCHGAFLLRALAGSGFKPIWSVSKSSALVARASLSERTGSGSATPLISAASSTGSTDQMQQRGSAEQCKCFEGIDAGKRHEMVTMTNRYEYF